MSRNHMCNDVVETHFSSIATPEELSTWHANNYMESEISDLDVMWDWDLPAHLGHVINYLRRRGKKRGSSEIDDLEKARFYLDDYIKRLKKERNK